MESKDIHKELFNVLWDTARNECCLTKLKAECIVMTTPSDMNKITKALLNNPEFIKLIKEL